MDTPTEGRRGPLTLWFATALWKRILLAVLLGALVGYFWGEGAASIQWIGALFVRMIRMIVVPLVFVTLAGGVAAMGDIRRLGGIGLKALALYMLTSVIAVAIGLGFAIILQPGAGVSLGDATPRELGQPPSIGDMLMNIVPINPVAALANGDMLAIIFFALIFGAGILVQGETARPMASILDQASAALLGATRIVMEVAPFGVFALIAGVMGTTGPSAFTSIFKLAIAVYGGCLLHMAITQGGLVRLFANLRAVRFFRDITEAQLLAYSTSSSAATLPVSMRVAEKNLGLKPPVFSSVLPLGATINMDGTALYVGLVAVFAAQAFGVPLGLGDYLVIMLTTVLVSIGTASVPSASLFLLAAVLTAIGITAEQTALVVGFILPFDRILDMMRTATNVTGDLAVATTVGKWEGEIDLETYDAHAAP
ncbi:MAG: cation:dicarboxylase symporter family transporter [Alphaproteobacteria bacterium]|nr:cation:dicarboxylase symporter family transporter [Alphaproteobacteria bacterium]